MAVAASLVLMPVPLSWVWRTSNQRLVVWAAVVAIDAILLMAARRSAPAMPPPLFAGRRHRLLFAALVGWVFACVAGSYWLTRVGGRLEPYPAHDFIKHHAVMLSLERHTLPLRSIFYAGEPQTPYYYYEYHYLVPAALRALSGNAVSIPFAFGLTAAVAAVAFVALVFLIARDVPVSSSGALVAAACVSIVGGWDIIPVLARVASGGPMVVTLDSWIPSPWRIHNLMTQYFWCPQHVSAAVVLLLCARWLRHAPRERWWVCVAPVAAAALFGSSVYLAIGAFAAVTVYVALELRPASVGGVPRKRLARAVAVIVVLGAVLMAAQAWGYREMGRRYPGGLTTEWPRLQLAAFGRLAPPGPPANWLDAPWILLIDLGVGAVASLLVARTFWSAVWQNAGTRLLVVAGAIGIALMLTVRSDINEIDYSFRLAVIPAMVVAALAAGAMVEGGWVRPAVRAWRKPILLIGVAMGLPVGLYQAPAMALRGLRQPAADAREIGAIRFLRDNLPREAVVQGDPKTRLALPQLADRPMGVLDPWDPDVRVFCPVDMGRMRAACDEIERAFRDSSGESAHRALRRWGITHVLVGRDERRVFGAMSQFHDRTWFAMLYDDGDAAVYRLVDEALPAAR